MNRLRDKCIGHRGAVHRLNRNETRRRIRMRRFRLSFVILAFALLVFVVDDDERVGRKLVYALIYKSLPDY